MISVLSALTGFFQRIKHATNRIVGLSGKAGKCFDQALGDFFLIAESESQAGISFGLGVNFVSGGMTPSLS
jgi:hypothetical protein